MIDIRTLEKEQMRTDLPEFSIGDTVRVNVKVVEGTRERIQAFEGTVIARRNGSIRETFTVRRISHNIGVERTFPSIPRGWQALRSSARARCAGPSCTICAALWVRKLRSRKRPADFGEGSHALRHESFFFGAGPAGLRPLHGAGSCRPFARNVPRPGEASHISVFMSWRINP